MLSATQKAWNPTGNLNRSSFLTNVSVDDICLLMYKGAANEEW